MATETLNVTFDGVNDVPRVDGKSPVEWFNKFMSYYSSYNSTANETLNANVDITGSDWKAIAVRFGAEFDNKTIVKDLDAGSGREIRLLELGFNSDVDLISTRVKYVTGWDGEKHDVTLGNSASGSTHSIGLFAKENVVTTGNQWVHSIITGWYDGPASQAVGDTITVKSGGAASIETSVGADTIVANGYVRALSTRDGGDSVTIGSNGAGLVFTGNGKDKVSTDGYVDGIHTYTGNDTVTTGDSGAGLIGTHDGSDVVKTGGGWVGQIRTGKGNDTVTMGSGGGGDVHLGDGNDLIKLNEMNPDYGLTVRGGEGVDTISFKAFTTGITFSLDLGGRYQNVAAPGGDPDLPGMGWFSEVLSENVIGSNKGDHITGDQNANVLTGLKGKDQLFGLAGGDKLDGGLGNDKLYGGDGFDDMKGGKGNDVLTGGKGKDMYTGGGGKDVFVFGANAGVDKVKDFTDGADIIRIKDHAGKFPSLTIVDQGADLKITHDGGTILLLGEAGTTLTKADFDFV